MNGFFHHLHHAFRRHNQHAVHRGFSGFGGHHGRRDPWQSGMDGWQRGRKLGAADLQLLLLALLAERPSHGYELIKALDERSNGYYSPSPGMVYPALTYLEEVGYASFETHGTKKLYRVTDAGRTRLDEQRAAVDALLQQLSWIGSKMERLRQAMAGAGREGQAGGDGSPGEDATADEASPRGFFAGHDRGRHAVKSPEIRAAWHDLKCALIDKRAATGGEQRRIAAVLEAAAAAIRTGSSDAVGGRGEAGPNKDQG